MTNNNSWKELYKEKFNENLNENFSLTKSKSIFSSRIQKESLLNYNFNSNKNEFGKSPYGKKLKAYDQILKFLFINYNLNQSLKKFSENNPSFKQFAFSKNPKVFKG